MVRSRRTISSHCGSTLAGHGQRALGIGVRAPHPACESLEARCLLSASFPSAQEQYALEVINRARASPTSEVALWSSRTWGDTQMPSDPSAPYFPEPQTPSLNEGLPAGTISSDAKQPLAFNPLLVDAAQMHSQYMLANDIFSHFEGSGNISPFDRFNNEGYTGYNTAGENIAARTIGPTDTAAAILLQQEGDLFVDNNESSSQAFGQRGHRQNLMNPNFREVGVGAVTGLFSFPGDPNQENTVLLTEDFAARPGFVFLTGVAYNDLNHNNFYDPGEGLGAVTITATRAGDNQVFSTTTWDAGGYSLQLAPGTYTVGASGGGIGSPAPATVTIGSLNVEADFNPAMPADHLLGTTIGDGTAQRSSVRNVTLKFDHPVTLGAGAVTLALLNSGGSGANNNGAPTDVSSVLAVPSTPDGGITWVLSFIASTAHSDSSGSLADGIYALTIHSAKVTDASTGASLSGPDQTITFHRLFGDINGDKKVNNADYFLFNKAFGHSRPDPLYNASFDFNGDGKINNSDYFQFNRNFGKTFSY